VASIAFGGRLLAFGAPVRVAEAAAEEADAGARDQTPSSAAAGTGPSTM
jgi:hypothetical protein